MGCIKGCIKNMKPMTFWGKLREEHNITFGSLSKELGLSHGALVTYFSGEHIPREYAARKICHFFNIDYEFGMSKFKSDHTIWDMRHDDRWHAHDKQRESDYHKKYIRNNAIPYCVSFDRTKDRDLLDKLDSIELGNRSPYIKWVLRQHLGNDKFSADRLTPEVQALLKVIYSEVPFEIFMQMLSTLIDSKRIDARILYGYVSYPTFIEIRKLENYI